MPTPGQKTIQVAVEEAINGVNGANGIIWIIVLILAIIVLYVFIKNQKG